MEKRTQRFSLRKYSFGLASIVLGTVVLAFGANPVSADETANGTSSEHDKRMNVSSLFYHRRSLF